MARQYAPVKVAIWADDDFRNLSIFAQHLYFLILTSPTLSHAGVADWRPKRLAALANGWSPDEVIAAGKELQEKFYVVIDEETEEILIRSFIRHDGLMKQPKMAVAMTEAHAAVSSPLIRGVIVHELRRLRIDAPDLSGWAVEKAGELLARNAIDPFSDPSPDDDPLPPEDIVRGTLWGSGTPKPTPKPTPQGKGSGKGSTFPAPVTNSCNYNQQPGYVASADPPPDSPQRAREIADQAETITAAWTKIRRELGAPPTRRQLGLVGQNLIEALTLGTAFDLVMGAAQNAARGGYVTVDVEIAKLTAAPKTPPGQRRTSESFHNGVDSARYLDELEQAAAAQPSIGG